MHRTEMGSSIPVAKAALCDCQHACPVQQLWANVPLFWRGLSRAEDFQLLMLKLLSLIVLLATVYGQDPGAAGGDLESVLAQIFGKPPAGGDATNTNTGSTNTGATSPPLPNNNSGAGNAGKVPQSIPPTVPSSGANVDTSCTTESGQAGECVNYYLCDVQTNTVNTDGLGIIDIRLKDGACESYLDTCCLLNATRQPDNPITPPPPKPEQQREGCGWRNPNGVGMETVGDVNGESKFGEFPWTVAIVKLEPIDDQAPSNINIYVGGGSLIHPSVVLTTAHYVAKAGKLRVRAGEWDTQTTKEIFPYQDRDVASVEVHKDFNGGNLFYDIAILFLTKPMTLAPNVGVACLPPQGEKAPAEARCFASGWGKDKFSKEGQYQVILKKVEVPVVSNRNCRDLLRKTRLGRLFELHHTFMCAGGEPGVDTCKGDGGAPLVCPIEFQKDRYVQNGMVAWGIGCGENGTPGVYVDVGMLRDWIDNKVAGKGYDVGVYSNY